MRSCAQLPLWRIGFTESRETMTWSKSSQGLGSRASLQAIRSRESMSSPRNIRKFSWKRFLISACHCMTRLFGTTISVLRTRPRILNSRMIRPASIVFPSPTSSARRYRTWSPRVTRSSVWSWCGNGITSAERGARSITLPPGRVRSKASATFAAAVIYAICSGLAFS